MHREIYTSIGEWHKKSGRKPLLLQGARQVGKTYALKKFGEAHSGKYHYFDLEEDKYSFQQIFQEGSLRPQEILTKLSFLSNEVIDSEKDLLILDEIQAVPRALTSLKYFQQDMSELAIIAAGSNLGVDSQSESFPVGKVECLTLYPLNFEEFLNGINKKPALNFISQFSGGKTDSLYHQQIFELLKIYFVTGGLPEIVSIYAEHQDQQVIALQKVRVQQKQLLRQYESDFGKYSGSTNGRHISRIFQAIPNQLARMQDKSAKKFIFKDIISKGYRSYEAVADPISWLEKAGLALRVSQNLHPSLPLSAGEKENSFKLFLFDVGLLVL